MIRRVLDPMLAGVLCLAMTGCNVAEKEQLRSKINDLAGQKQSITQTAAQEELGIETLNERLKVQTAERGQYQARVEGYMMDHKMAVVAIAAGVAGAALDSHNAFSEDAKNMGGVVVAIAAIYALANLDEVSEVVKNLNQADADVHVLDAKMRQTRSEIQEQQQRLQSSEGELTQVTQQITHLQTRLDNL